MVYYLNEGKIVHIPKVLRQPVTANNQYHYIDCWVAKPRITNISSQELFRILYISVLAGEVVYFHASVLVYTCMKINAPPSKTEISRIWDCS